MLAVYNEALRIMHERTGDDALPDPRRRGPHAELARPYCGCATTDTCPGTPRWRARRSSSSSTPAPRVTARRPRLGIGHGAEARGQRHQGLRRGGRGRSHRRRAPRGQELRLRLGLDNLIVPVRLERPRHRQASRTPRSCPRHAQGVVRAVRLARGRHRGGRGVLRARSRKALLEVVHAESTEGRPAWCGSRRARVAATTSTTQPPTARPTGATPTCSGSAAASSRTSTASQFEGFGDTTRSRRGRLPRADAFRLVPRRSSRSCARTTRAGRVPGQHAGRTGRVHPVSQPEGFEAEHSAANLAEDRSWLDASTSCPKPSSSCLDRRHQSRQQGRLQEVRPRGSTPWLTSRWVAPWCWPARPTWPTRPRSRASPRTSTASRGFGWYERDQNPTGALLPQQITEFANAGLVSASAWLRSTCRPTPRTSLPRLLGRVLDLRLFLVPQVRDDASLQHSSSQDCELEGGQGHLGRGTLGPRDGRGQPHALRHLRAGRHAALPRRAASSTCIPGSTTKSPPCLAAALADRSPRSSPCT